MTRNREAAIHQAAGVLLSVVPERARYDVVISRAMPAHWADRLGGCFWYWRVEFAGYPVAAGFAWTEHGAERKAALTARRHHQPPARAKHVPARTYSINL